jgi:8-oxo-dGTP pyrophosphatase MutT (NUDIX family)
VNPAERSPSVADQRHRVAACDAQVERVRSAVTRHPAADRREERSKSVILAELDRLPHPFDQGADLTHVTASAIVVGRRGVILHRHRVLHRWLQPGGHLEPGESPDVAVLRECQEETGLIVAHPVTGPSLVHVDVHAAARDHVHLDLRYLVSGPDDEPHPGPGESQEVAWFAWDVAESMADEALAGALRTARSVIGVPPAMAAAEDESETP